MYSCLSFSAPDSIIGIAVGITIIVILLLILIAIIVFFIIVWRVGKLALVTHC